MSAPCRSGVPRPRPVVARWRWSRLTGAPETRRVGHPRGTLDHPGTKDHGLPGGVPRRTPSPSAGSRARLSTACWRRALAVASGLHGTLPKALLKRITPADAAGAIVYGLETRAARVMRRAGGVRSPRCGACSGTPSTPPSHRTVASSTLSPGWTPGPRCPRQAPLPHPHERTARDHLDDRTHQTGVVNMARQLASSPGSASCSRSWVMASGRSRWTVLPPACSPPPCWSQRP